MSSTLNHLSVTHHIDLVYIHNGGESMSTVDHSLALQDLIKLLYDSLFIVRVEAAGCLIEENDLGVLEQSSCNKDTLLLSSRELAT